MTLLLEKAPVELYETELAATPVPESPADLLPATPPQAPPVAATDLAGVNVKVSQLDADGNPTGSWVEYQTGGPVTVTVTPSWFVDLPIATTAGLWGAAISECGCGCRTMLAPPHAPTPQEVAACLTGAADRIDRAGWTRRTLFSGERSCAQGAITYQAAGGRRPVWPLTGHTADLFGRANYALATWLRGNAPDWVPGMSVPMWNDMPHRTQGEVTGALRSAAQAVLAEAERS